MINDVYKESKFTELMFQFLATFHDKELSDFYLISDKTTAIKCWLTIEIHVSFFALYTKLNIKNGYLI